jgi:hypothetical protein
MRHKTRGEYPSHPPHPLRDEPIQLRTMRSNVFRLDGKYLREPRIPGCMADHPDDIGDFICLPSDRLRARTGNGEEADRIVAEQGSSPAAWASFPRGAVSIGLQNNESPGFGRDTVEPGCWGEFDLQVELLIRGWTNFRLHEEQAHKVEPRFHVG